MSALKLPERLEFFSRKNAENFARTGCLIALEGAFLWSSSPQGLDFWHGVYLRKTPADKAQAIVRGWLGMGEPKKAKPRPETLTEKLATACQKVKNGTFATAEEGGRECMRIIDNHQRASGRRAVEQSRGVLRYRLRLVRRLGHS